MSPVASSHARDNDSFRFAAAPSTVMHDSSTTLLEQAYSRQSLLYAPTNVSVSGRRCILTTEERLSVLGVLNGPLLTEVLIEIHAIDITPKKLQCLRPRTWLNDEIINVYFAMLNDGDQTSYCFNTFFMEKLLGPECHRYSFSEVQRWTKHFDVFSQPRILFPVDIRNNHWTLLVIYIPEKEIHYFDSMGSNGSKKYLEPILQVYLAIFLF